MGLLSKLFDSQTAPQILEKVCKRLEAEYGGLPVDLTDNESQFWSGGLRVSFGWYDEHRFNEGGFYYPQMTVFNKSSHEFAVGIGKTYGEYIMNGMGCDLRLLHLQSDTKKLQERISNAFENESGFKSTVLVAESSELSSKGRLYYPLPQAYNWNSSLRNWCWSDIVTTDVLRAKLPEGYTTEPEFRYNDNRLIVNSSKKTHKTATYPSELVDTFVWMIKDLMYAKIKSEAKKEKAATASKNDIT